MDPAQEDEDCNGYANCADTTNCPENTPCGSGMTCQSGSCQAVSCPQPGCDWNDQENCCAEWISIPPMFPGAPGYYQCC